MILSILQKTDVSLVNNCHIGNVGWSGLDNVKYVYEISRHCVDSFLIFTACKRSLGQGNFFTGVCLSTEDLCMMSLPDWLPGLIYLFGGLCPRGSEDLFPGGLFPGRGLCRENPRNQKSERYASCWNTLLFNEISYSLSQSTAFANVVRKHVNCFMSATVTKK